MKTKILISIIISLYVLNVFSQDLSDTNTSIISDYFASAKIATTSDIDNTKQFLPIADVVIRQEGNYNEVSLQTARHSEVQVNQQGNNNSFELFSYYNSNKTDISTNQLGDNNDIQMFGYNEIVKGIKINQTTNDQTLIIINR